MTGRLKNGHQKVPKSDSLCIDVGRLKGETFQAMIDSAPNVHHKAFEPVPQQYVFLKEQFRQQGRYISICIGNENKQTTFHHVVIIQRIPDFSSDNTRVKRPLMK
ncbi:MAG: hypothetical protein IPP25_20300 [Saprospiraceae bacterium]|nr:hypothetical protein [Candidatus Opimibacter skivensis]